MEGKRPARRGWEASMSVALGLGLSFFVLTAIAGVLGAGIISGYQNTVDLLKQKADLLVASEINQTERYLGAAEDQAAFIVRQITTGDVTPGRDEAFTSLLSGALSATPQIVAIQFVDRDLRLVGAIRQDFDVMVVDFPVGQADDRLVNKVEGALFDDLFQFGDSRTHFRHQVAKPLAEIADGEFALGLREFLDRMAAIDEVSAGIDAALKEAV